MPRDGSGNFTLPSNTQAVSGDPISSTKFNTLVQDLEADANVDRPIAAGGTGASTALAARANLGLEIGVNVQAYDAGLLSIAGLTTLADRSIYTTASDTYAVYTLTAAGRAILDDADAAAQRTTLGLGTAAVKNTGTSGDAVPLLDQANTFSATQTFTATEAARFSNGWTAAVAGVVTGLFYSHETGGWTLSTNRQSAGNERYFSFNASGSMLIGGSTVWHAGNDGAGSGLDADTLDGVQGSAYAQLSGATFTGVPVVSAAAPRMDFQDSDAADGSAISSEFIRVLDSGGTRRASIQMTSNGLYFNIPITSGNFVWRAGTGFTNVMELSESGFVARTQPSTETTSTLTVASANKTIQATGDITIPNAVFSAGDIILIYAGASSRTITQGSSVTMRLGGTATTGSRTLAARGVAMLFFVSSSEVIVSGGAVT